AERQRGNREQRCVKPLHRGFLRNAAAPVFFAVADVLAALSRFYVAIRRKAQGCRSIEFRGTAIIYGKKNVQSALEARNDERGGLIIIFGLEPR
ncbi:hypothetical protein, partial [Telmatospirillum sp.]|uniref:hypothetical protein n=1 Tax=Telmatospirillum sp. TaxID=2079197 RepID=UPI00284C0150